jgi:hypothetical protein
VVGLNNNRVGTLPDDLFENSTNVEYFQMAYTQLHRDTIVKIGEGYFGQNIKNLWIRGNYIQLPNDGMFNGLPKLKRQTLMSDCGINYIRSDILKGTQVTRVDLDGNPILIIHENAFRDSKVSTFQCNGCQLTSQVTFNGFLKKMPLRVIRLRNNNLTRVPNNAFSGLTKLFLIDLSNNAIATIDENPYANLPNCYHSRCIQLGNNPLNCDCNLAWFRTFANNIKGNRTLWKCARPRSVNGGSLVSIKIDEFCCENANSTKRCGSVPDPNNGWAVSAHMIVAILSHVVLMFGIPFLRA